VKNSIAKRIVVRSEEAHELDHQRAQALTYTTAPQTAPAHDPRTTRVPTLVDTLTDIRAPPKSNKRTAVEATLPNERATPQHSHRTRTDSATNTQRLHQSLRDNRRAKARPLHAHNRRKRARTQTNLPPQPTHETPIEKIYEFVFQACTSSGHTAYLHRPDPNIDNLTINIETRTGMATLLLTLKADQWYLAVVGPPPVDASKPLRAPC
jgi:hypothetical protein